MTTVADLRTLSDLGDLEGRRALVRVDFNVPLQDGRITDDGRIRAALPTIAALAAAGARVILCSHLGRPAAPNPAFSLAPVGHRLAELMGLPVPMAADVVGDSAHAVADRVAPGGIALLENLRFDPGETADDPAFADALARLGEVYVGDAFGAVHRAHASVSALPARLPHAAGRLIVRELGFLEHLATDPERPYVVALGGSKVSDKLDVIGALLARADRLLIGGAMCFTFLAAQGLEVGRSLVQPDHFEAVRQLRDTAAARGVEIVLPVDVVVAAGPDDTAGARVVGVSEIPPEEMGLDIGPATVRAFTEALDGAATVFWNGPMGMFERPAFAAGTRGVALAVADCGAFSVIGGGDSAAAVRLLGIPEARYGHLSTGGGASLEYLEGKELPGLVALQ